MIDFKNVSKVYFDKMIALDQISFKIEPGEFVSIVGQSGAGKSTLLKMILAEEKPTEGSVFFETININSLNPKNIHILRRRIGSIFQDFRLLPQKTTYENISFIMEAAGRSDEEIKEDVPYVLDLVGLSTKMWHFPFELSGGERQRVAIARAIVNQPDLLIADEPTGNLDPLNAHEIIDIFQNINKLGTTIILTTHNKGVIDNLGKRVITLDKGRITRDNQEGRYII